MFFTPLLRKLLPLRSNLRVIFVFSNMNYCKYLKNKNKKPFCKKYNGEIKLSQCSGCDFKSYKTKNEKNSFYKLNNHQISNPNKNIRKSTKKKNKRITVSKETYEAVIQRDTYCCRLIGTSPCEGWLELHHILYRSQRKDLINDIDNCIMLCTKHHKLVHSNKKCWQPILLEMNKKNH